MENKRDSSPKTVSPSESLQKTNGRLGSLHTLDHSFIWKDAVGLTTKELSKSVGSERIYVNLDIIPPGAYSTKYHSHSYQEEFFYILSGTGTLRLNDETYPVAPEDFLAKPAGRNIAHTFYNSGPENLCILDIGTADPEDTCYYPDERMYLHKTNGESRPYHADSVDTGWSSEPNKPNNDIKPKEDNQKGDL